MAIVEPKEELSKMGLLLVSSLSKQFKYSEDISKIIVKIYLTSGSVNGQIPRDANRTLLEEIRIRKFLDMTVKQNRETPIVTKPIYEYATTSVTLRQKTVEQVAEKKLIKQTTSIKLRNSDIMVTVEKKPEQTIVKQETPTPQKIKKRPHEYQLKKTSAIVVTSKDPPVIKLCNKFSIEQVQAEKCIECYKDRFKGVSDMAKMAGIQNGKAGQIYNYLPTIGMKRNPLTVGEPRRKLKSKVH